VSRQDREPFQANPYFADEVNDAIISLEIEGGFTLRDLLIGDVLEVETKDHILSIERREDCVENEYYVSGHIEFYPEPLKVRIAGSKLAHEGHGMISSGRVEHCKFLELRLPSQGLLEFITTAEIISIKHFPKVAH